MMNSHASYRLFLATPVLCAVLAASALSTRASAAPPIGGVAMPSLDDEKNTYRSWGWTWTASQEPNYPSAVGYTVTDPDVHGDTEGDDLWAYLMAYLRTGQRGFLDRAQAWATYFKTRYRTCQGTPSLTYCYDRDNFGLDHVYGYGLIAWSEYSGDAAALTEAENIGADIEQYWATRANNSYPVPGQFGMAYYGLRQGARHLLLITRLAEVTGKSRWITLRDRLIDLWMQSPDWDPRGMYFYGDFATDQEINAGAYAGGARIMSAFHIGLLTEALSHAYRTTHRTDIRDHLVAMASFVDQYGMDPTYQYTASYFGIVNGHIWHSYNTGAGPVTFWDPVYTTTLVNTLMNGYNFTGDAKYLNRAKHFFNRGTKGIYGEPTQRAAGDTQVHHFVDTLFDSSSTNFYLNYNRGELLYTYLLLGTSGVVSPAAPTGLTAH